MTSVCYDIRIILLWNENFSVKANNKQKILKVVWFSMQIGL